MRLFCTFLLHHTGFVFLEVSRSGVLLSNRGLPSPFCCLICQPPVGTFQCKSKQGTGDVPGGGAHPSAAGLGEDQQEHWHLFIKADCDT